jgi:hypothetical protein
MEAGNLTRNLHQRTRRQIHGVAAMNVSRVVAVLAADKGWCANFDTKLNGGYLSLKRDCQRGQPSRAKARSI